MINNHFSAGLSEILGAFIGDGWIESSKKGLYILGDINEDKEYYDKYLSRLFINEFGEVKLKLFKKWNVYGLISYKKEIINKAISLGFQPGKKCYSIKIPEIIMKSKIDYKISVIRGIFDTDGSFWCEKSRAKTSTSWKKTHNYHPEFNISSCSEKLLIQIKEILDELNIESKIVQKRSKGVKSSRIVNDSFALMIRKISEIEKWFKIVGTNNPRHITRYRVWKKLGFLPPYSTIKEKYEILEKMA